MSRVVVALKFDETEQTSALFAKTIAEKLKHDFRTLMVGDVTEGNTINLHDLTDQMELLDASMLVIEIQRNKDIQKRLDICRELRIPYLFVRPNSVPTFDKVALPVTFLTEEKEKGPFAAAFGRFAQSHITIFKPKDYGSRAAKNIDAMKTLFDSFSLNYEVLDARKDSDGVEREAAIWADENADMVIISASREYGLDDIIFGSKERKILEHNQKPTLLINPRGDLYALCD